MTVFCRSSGHAARPPHAALFLAAGMTVALCSGCGSTDTAPSASDTSGTQASPSSSTAIGSQAPTTVPACNVGKPGPPSISSVFVDLPRQYAVKEICAADVGPGLADGAVAAELSDLAAGEVTYIYSSPDSTALKGLAGTVESGKGDAFVDAFLSRVGERRNDTVTLGGRTVRYFNTPSGEGYAYAEGPTVAIGYISPPGVDLAATQESAKDVFSRILAAATGTPIPADEHPDTGIDTYSPGRGRYTTPDDPGWVFFTTKNVKGVPGHTCGIGPNGALA